MLTKAELSEPVDEFGIAYAETEYSPLWTIKAGAGNCNSLVKIFYKMLDQGGTGARNVWVADLAMHLRTRYK